MAFTSASVASYKKTSVTINPTILENQIIDVFSKKIRRNCEESYNKIKTALKDRTRKINEERFDKIKKTTSKLLVRKITENERGIRPQKNILNK